MIRLQSFSTTTTTSISLLRSVAIIFVGVLLLHHQDVILHVDALCAVCSNGATCQDSKCICLSGFWSFDCSRVCPLTCLNGGQCLSDTHLQNGGDGTGGVTAPTSSFTCDCPPTHTGSLCDELITSTLICANDNQCQNGGSCNPEDSKCNCPTTYTGPFCDTDVSLLCFVDSDCMNFGQCDAETSTCDCPPSHTGSFCQELVVASMICSNDRDCRNGGTCNGEDSKCNCPSDYTGPFCTIAVVVASPASAPAPAPAPPPSWGLQTITRPPVVEHNTTYDDQRDFGWAVAIAMGSTMVMAWALFFILTRIRRRGGPFSLSRGKQKQRRQQRQEGDENDEDEDDDLNSDGIMMMGTMAKPAAAAATNNNNKGMEMDLALQIEDHTIT